MTWCPEKDIWRPGETDGWGPKPKHLPGQMAGYEKGWDRGFGGFRFVRKRGEAISFLKGAKSKATKKTHYLTSPLILFLSSPRWLEGRKLGLGFLATAPSVLVPKYHFSIWRKRLLASSLKLSGFSLFIILYKGKRKEEREPDTFSKPTAPFRAASGVTVGYGPGMLYCWSRPLFPKSHALRCQRNEGLCIFLIN